MSETNAAPPAAETTPEAGSAAPKKPRVPRKGADAAYRIIEATTNPGPLATLVGGNSDQRGVLLDAADKSVEAAERHLAHVKAHRAELLAMSVAIEGMGGAALLGVQHSLAAKIKDAK